MTGDPTADMQRQAAEIQRLAVEAEGEAVSEDGAVRVVAGAAGNLKVLDLRLNAFQLSGYELGELIVETIQAADRKVAAELSEAMTRVMGTATPADFLSGGVRRIDPDSEDQA
ncbi:YbaB/EbfC family nucleoid-associated protein [Glycomyces harbinensis]|uniref:Conserved DNA-binding protein YbaB n=1 Tax=Glycomyces harbinensis TaxID=58114 RepID=A0A1G6Y4T6_9ACTN|nr:YbaB/EbfC family nucleoid-associated protein [Glycomyces harbinensis]SDD84586.1 Conserved DNA-binding protein YbaB [Glycomyces harbinensis]